MKREELVKRLAQATLMNDKVRLEIFRETYLDHLSDQERESIKAEVTKQVEADKAESLKQAKSKEATGAHATLKIDDLTLKPK